MDGNFNGVCFRFQKAADFLRAERIYRSSNPDTIRAARIQDEKDPGDNIDTTKSRLIVTVTSKGGSGPDAVKTVLKLHKARPMAHPNDSHKQKLYMELLVHMFIHKCEADIRKDNMDRLIAWCKPSWYKFNMCQGFELEYFPEGTLRNLPSDSVDNNERLSLLRDAARGLHFLNCIRIIHWDVKPSNICVFMREDGTRTTKLIDFGSAKFKGQLVDRRRASGDTLCYRPPELFPRHGDSHDDNMALVSPLADSWRFGMCVLEVMTGIRLPLWKRAKGDDPTYEEFLKVNPILLADKGEFKAGNTLQFPGLDTSKQLECALKLLSNLLRPNPTERYDMEQVIKDIELHLDGKPPRADSSGKAEASSSEAYAGSPPGVESTLVDGCAENYKEHTASSPDAENPVEGCKAGEE